jgi:DNA-binding beta-propeller fold protein YncE
MGVTLTLALQAGCGGKFDLPTERRDVRSVAGAGTYQMITTRTGLPGIYDLLLTPSGELFLLFKTGPVSGVVHEFPPGLNYPLSTTFPDLLNPGALAFGNNHVFALDQGDTASARTTSPSIYTAECGPVSGFNRPIVDLSRYWRVREYALNGGPSLSTFTDTTFLWVNGIAADQAGRVYVSGVVMVCLVDPFDTRIKTLAKEVRIRRYERGPAEGTVIGDNWRRDPGWEVIEGTGIGSARDPRGMQWAFTLGSGLYFADPGNDEVQKFADPGLGFSFKIDFGGIGADSLHLLDPVDVSVDSAGFVYVADFGNKRVLRFESNGDFVQRVDIETDANGDSLLLPLAVTADNEQVYVADPGRSEVVRYRRRK